jgi:hypothetical protein
LSYASAEYVRSLADFGAPRQLHRSAGWMLERPIPGTDGLRDACGPYPLFTCRNWSGLDSDLDDLREAGLVSLVLVADPLCNPPTELLPRWFDGVCRPWKEHHLVDLARADAFGSDHHRRNARRFNRHATVEVLPDPANWLDTWCGLYETLVERHGITGPARFSRAAFAGLLTLPGVVVLRAVTTAGVTAGMQIWLTDGQRAWHHLSAYGREGYRWGGASYALVLAALELLRFRGAKVVDLGGGAGLTAEYGDGLDRFKRGWSTHTAPAWLCGTVLDADRYAALHGDHATDYFPAYRDPDLVDAPEVTHAGRD